MPKKRTRGSGSRTRFDHSKFVSAEAAKGHTHSLVHKVPIPNQRPEDRPNIISRVFRLKLRYLMEDLMKNKNFGFAIAGKPKLFTLNIFFYI